MNKQLAWIAALAFAAFGSLAEAQTITAVYTTYSDAGVPTKLDITGTAFCTATGSPPTCGTKPPVVRLGGNLVSISGSSPTGIGVPLTGLFADGDYLLSVTPSGKSAINYAFTLKSKTGGAIGPQGPIGPMGPVGPAGSPGSPGLQGPKGDAGAAGANGSQGPMGLQGPQGPAGTNGAQGPIGPQGPVGQMQPGSVTGSMLYWNGTDWLEVLPPSVNGVGLIFCDGKPQWSATCPLSANDLLGQWAFNTVPVTDLSGHWSQFSLQGTAHVAGGELLISGSGDGNGSSIPTGWARADGYSGPDIKDKTFIAWVALDALTSLGGAPIAMNKPITPGSDHSAFDAVVWGEAGSYWMAGSNNLFRTSIPANTPQDNQVGGIRQIAISYRDVGGGTQEITACFNGVQYFRYQTNSILPFSAADVPVVMFGPRSLDAPAWTPYGSITGRVNEARLYGRALTCSEVAALSSN